MKPYFEGIETVSNRPPTYTQEEERQAALDLEARERARIAEAKRQAEEEKLKRATGELPIISDEEYENTKRRYGIK